MKGLELAREYYETFGKPLIEKEFAEFKNRIAVGLVGHGSECFGFDDEISKDHDFGPGFCLWITEEDEKRFGFKLFRAYSKLPKEFKGIKIEKKGLFSSKIRGVQIIEDFYSFYLGAERLPKTNLEWLSIEDCYLASATNGEVFADPLGEFTRVREYIKSGQPLDVKLKRLADALFNMAQAGQYNYERCLKHGEPIAAATYLSDFVKSAAKAVYILNNAYMPYTKWAFRGMEDLKILAFIKKDLEQLMKAPYNQKENVFIIEKIATSVIKEIKNRYNCDIDDDYLEPYAYFINDKIEDGNLRNMPIIL